MAIYTGTRGPNKVDRELLSYSNGANISDAEYNELLARLDSLERTTNDLVVTQSSINSIDNLLWNSDFSFSTNGWTGAGSATELYKWYFGANTANVITTATDPLWDNVYGSVVIDDITAAKDLSFNFDKRIILPGFTYYFTFIAKKQTAGDTASTKLYLGLWDDATSDYMKGEIRGDSTHASPIVTPTGGTGATTYKYVVVAITDTNNVIVSAETTIANGVAVLDSSHYNNISWAVTSGILSYYVFRTSGTVALIANLPSGNSSYNDTGTDITSPATVPTAAAPKAYTEVTDFGMQLTTDWQLFRGVIKVPGGYNLNGTGATQQWLRLHLDNTAPAVGIQIDRIGLSTLPGGWAASSKDVQATGDIGITPVGDGGSGGKGVDPYGDGDGSFIGFDKGY